MTDAERRPMQRMIATGPRFARKGHGRPQEGGSHASQCHPQPEALQGLQCVVPTEPQKTSCCRAFPEFSEQYAQAREAGIRAGIHEIGICIAVLVTRPVTTEKRDACQGAPPCPA